MEEVIRNLDRIRDNLHYHSLSGTVIVDTTAQPDKYKLETFFNAKRNEFSDNGLDLSDKFQATINVNIAPLAVRVFNPRLKLSCSNYMQNDKSDFAFSRCRIHYDGSHFYAVLYHRLNDNNSTSTVEVIAPYIPGIKPGDPVQIDLSSNEVELVEEIGHA